MIIERKGVNMYNVNIVYLESDCELGENVVKSYVLNYKKEAKKEMIDKIALSFLMLYVIDFNIYEEREDGEYKRLEELKEEIIKEIE